MALRSNIPLERGRQRVVVRTWQNSHRQPETWFDTFGETITKGVVASL